jgi:DNA repair protein RadC
MDNTWLIGLRGQLAKHGLIVSREEAADERTGTFLIRGQTLQLEAALVAAGGVWDRDRAAWRMASPGHLMTLAARLGHEVSYDLPPRDSEMGGLRESFGASDTVQVARLPVDDRIRRLAKLPTEVLEPDEIIEIMVALGTSVKEPRELAARLLRRFRDLGAVLAAENHHYKECLSSDKEELAYPLAKASSPQRHWELSTLFKTTWELLQRVLKEEIKDRPVIGSWTALIDYLAAAMQHGAVEQFRILFLDRKNILIHDEVLSRGTVDHTPLYPREVVKRALELAASAIIMVHNHPSGDPTPSGPDVEMTKQVVAALGQVGIAVHDHIIVGKNRHTSFRSLKLL